MVRVLVRFLRITFYVLVFNVIASFIDPISLLFMEDITGASQEAIGVVLITLIFDAIGVFQEEMSRLIAILLALYVSKLLRLPTITLIEALAMGLTDGALESLTTIVAYNSEFHGAYLLYLYLHEVLLIALQCGLTFMLFSALTNHDKRFLIINLFIIFLFHLGYNWISRIIILLYSDLGDIKYVYAGLFRVILIAALWTFIYVTSYRSTLVRRTS